MKRVLLILFLCSVVGASVDVNNYTVKNDYFLLENIDGEIDLTIEGEEYNEEFSFGSQEILFGDFLVSNGVLFDCVPTDCSMGYDSSDPAADKSFEIFGDHEYVGFVLEGEDVVLSDLSFDIESDFGRSFFKPLSINFFEREEWSFDVFSDEFMPRDWGCYDLFSREEGSARIGESFYCEMINIQDSGSLMVGADVLGVGSVELEMVVYPEGGSGASWDCPFDPSIEDGCEIPAGMGEIFPAGNYQVCVGADSSTEYIIYEESTGDNCGFAYDFGPEDSVKDYGVYARVAKYEDANFLGSVDFGEDIVAAANDLIMKRYEGDCLDGCVLPLAISGVSQNMRIHNISLVYTKDRGELHYDDLIYELEEVPAEVDFDGVLDLGLLGYSVSEDGEFVLKLGNEVLIEEIFSIFPAPIIDSVFPLNPPAGVPVDFFAVIDFEDNGSLEYRWDFGDGGVVVSDVSHVSHVYNDLSNYTLSLEVSAGGNMTSSNSFEINVISPEEAIGTGLELKRNNSEKIRFLADKFSIWYEESLLELLEIDYFDAELDRLDRKMNNSFSGEGFRDIAVELYALNMPNFVGMNSIELPFLMTMGDDIDVEPVAIISGGSDSSGDYATPILNWQNEKISVNFSQDDVLVSYENGEEKKLLVAYSFDVLSSSDSESYFVINKPFNELYFKDSVGEKKVGDATIIILAAGERKSFEFYYEGSGDVGVFVSPKLSSLVLEAEIDTTCNYDLICDEGAGENVETCRSDCKPVAKAWTLWILGVLFLLVVYTGLQIWYKRNYEGYLFKDRAQMYNILMYVTNARARGMKDPRISAELRAKGWSSERVNYIVKKSRGQKVGMVEIIPIERVSAYLRNKKARTEAAKRQGALPGVNPKGIVANQQLSSGMKRVP